MGGIFNAGNYQFNQLAIQTIFSAFIILILGLYILFQGRNRIENGSFFALSFTLFLWLFGIAMCEGSRDSHLALLWYKRCSFLGVTLIGVTIYVLVVSTVNQFPEHKKRIFSACLISIAFYLLANSNTSLVTGVLLTPWGYYPQHSSLAVIFIAYFLALLIYSLVPLVSALKATTDDLKRKQIILFIIALVFGYTGSFDFLLSFGFQIYPFGYISILFFAALTGYAVKKYSFLVLDPGVALPVIFDAVSNFIIGIDNEKRINFINRSVQEVFGYKEEEIAGQPIEKIFVEQEKFLQIRDGILLEKAPAWEEDTCFLTKDGREVFVRFSLSPIRDKRHKGRVLGFVLTAADITRHKQAEEELMKHRDHLEELVKEQTAELSGAIEQLQREITERKRTEDVLRVSEEKYRNVLESIEDGYYEGDIAGNFTSFNDSLCVILGYPKNELIGMNFSNILDQENGIKAFKVFNNVYKTGKPDKGFDWEVIRKDGTKRYIEESVSLITDTEGQGIGFRGIMRDITEKKRLEAQLSHAQKMEALGTLAGGIAHNFNNLLMGIQGNASLMLLDADSNHPNYERLKNIEKQVQSGSRLTRQLLGYAREGKYEIKPISLNQLVKETVNTFSMAKKEIKVHQELAEELFGIIADLGQIEQVLLNLFVNAADAMPGGGKLFLKAINITHEDIKGKPYEVKPGNYILLTVRDTGIGMEKKTMERIFDPFFTTKGLSKGTGLGLASAYGIIKAHGGYIDVESEKGSGTTFEIYLPASEKKTTKEKKIATKVIKGEETVLLVDDEDMIIGVAGEILRTLGYKVLVARGGKEAIELYNKNRDNIDIVLLDMIMPDIGGGEAFDRMKEMNPDIKVLLSSGYSMDGQAAEIINRGCKGFIQKPFSMEQLSQKIREILRV